MTRIEQQKNKAERGRPVQVDRPATLCPGLDPTRPIHRLLVQQVGADPVAPVLFLIRPTLPIHGTSSRCACKKFLRYALRIETQYI
jgi:hypothetical protein